MARKKIEKYKILDLFVFWEDEKEPGKILIEVTKKGKDFLNKHRELNPNFDEQKYLQDFFVKALQSYLDASNTKTSN